MKTALVKKNIVSTAVVLLALFLPNIAAAAETPFKQCTISALHMNISVPDEYIVITRETQESDPVWNDLGISWADGQKLLGDYVYLTAIGPSREYEIIVTSTKTKSGATNLSDLSDSQIKELSDGFKSYYSQNGVTVDGISLIEQSGVKYFKINGWLRRGNYYDYEVEYSTVRNSNSINITTHFYSSSSSIGAEEQKVLETLAQSAFSSVSYTDKTMVSSQTVDTHNDRGESIFSKAISKVFAAAILGAIFGGFSIFKNKNKKRGNEEKDNTMEAGQGISHEETDSKPEEQRQKSIIGQEDALLKQQNVGPENAGEERFIEKTDNGMPVWISENEVDDFAEGQQRQQQGERSPNVDRRTENIMQRLKGENDGDSDSVQEAIEESGNINGVNVPMAPEKEPKPQIRSQNAGVSTNNGSNVQYPIVSFCRKCGSKLIPGSKYCNKCGAKIYEISS